MKDDEMTLHIRDDRSIHLEFRENGENRTKVISIDTLVECIKNSLSGFNVNSGVLPANTVSITIDTKTSQRFVTMEFPEKTATVTYMNTEYKDFPLPRLLFGFCVESSGRISGVNLGVPALGKLTPETQMYYYPFSNVNRFYLCTGSNSLPHIKALQQLSNLPYFILSLPDNDDYYKEHNNRLGLGHRDLLEHLQDKDQNYYYEQVLVPMANTTLQNFI